MSKFWSEVVHGLTPYVPGEQPKLPNLVKLNTNENPYGPGTKVLAALQTEVADTLRLYPDPNSDRLRQAIADHFHLAPGNVFVGNGSDEVLAHTFQALLKHDQPILFPDITYSFYPVYCGLYGIPFETVPLNQAFELDIMDYRRPNGGIIFPNPNAPTSIALALESVERLLNEHPDNVVVVDEAYIDFGGESAVPLIGKHPNLLVIHTLSKSRSLAGLRVGYALGHPDLIEALSRVKDSFNSYPLDRFAQAGALAAMQDTAHFEETRRKVIATRERLVKRLRELGLEVLPPAANFILARHPDHSGADLTAKLRERSIIVRHFRKPDRIAPFMRITVGIDEQCDMLVSALREILS